MKAQFLGIESKNQKNLLLFQKKKKRRSWRMSANVLPNAISRKVNYFVLFDFIVPLFCSTKSQLANGIHS
jgi:hypothetical protein